MRYDIIGRLALSVLLGCAVLFTSAAGAAESPRLVITDLKLPRSLSERERNVVRQLDIVQTLREELLDSRTFRVLVRENESVQAILRERQIQGSPLAREGKDDALGLDSAEYFLEPTLQSFSLRTHYEPMPLLPGMYERTDSASMQLAVRVFDGGGNTVFEETVQASAGYPAREATEAEKARSAPRELGPIRKAAKSMTRRVVGAIVARVNPITVIDVQPTVFIIDRGRNNGFDKNTRFAVYAPSRTVVHKVRGDEISVPGRYLGEARLATVFEDVAELKLTEGELKEVVPGCVVRIIEE